SRTRSGWILDGGSTTHICSSRSAFTTFIPANDVINSISKNGPQLNVLGYGDVDVPVSVQGQSDRTITLRNVCFTPDSRRNLISESHL
ncbi:hypothetical protein BJ138DRAFT_975022, partial [Hygrophoropsis aurantiaca]